MFTITKIVSALRGKSRYAGCRVSAGESVSDLDLTGPVLVSESGKLR